MVKRYDTPVGYMDEHKEGFYVEYEDYAALRAKLAELAQCRDHWKTSYEDVRAKLKQAEDNRDLYFDDLNITKTTLHLAEKALAAQEAELSLYRKAVGPVVKAERFTKTDESWAAKMCKCCDAVRTCIRILGEAGNESHPNIGSNFDDFLRETGNADLLDSPKVTESVTEGSERG
jgi:hypothetical protein